MRRTPKRAQQRSAFGKSQSFFVFGRWRTKVDFADAARVAAIAIAALRLRLRTIAVRTGPAGKVVDDLPGQRHSHAIESPSHLCALRRGKCEQLMAVNGTLRFHFARVAHRRDPCLELPRKLPALHEY